jgi:ribonuclease P protein component
MIHVARLLTKWSPSSITQARLQTKYRFRGPIGDIRLSPSLLSYGRLLLVVPGSVVRGVARNRIRRRLKALFYEQALYTKGYDWILYLKPSALVMTPQEIIAEYTNVLNTVASKY